MTLQRYKKKVTYTRVYAIFPYFLGIFYNSNLFIDAKRIIFLTQETDHNRYHGDCHFAGRRIPTQLLHAQFQAEIVNRQTDGYNQNIPQQLSRAVQIRLREGHVFLEPKAC